MTFQVGSNPQIGKPFGFTKISGTPEQLAMLAQIEAEQAAGNQANVAQGRAMPQPELHVPENPPEDAIPEHNEEDNQVNIQQAPPEIIKDEAQELFKQLDGMRVDPRDYADFYENENGAIKSGISPEKVNAMETQDRIEKIVKMQIAQGRPQAFF